MTQEEEPELAKRGTGESVRSELARVAARDLYITNEAEIEMLPSVVSF
jgi:hypothetical protein